MTELKHCPFCGGEGLEVDHFRTYDLHHPDVYEVHCPDCGGRGGEGWTEAEAVAAWNTRAERTCHIEQIPECMHDDIECDECGVALWAFSMDIEGKGVFSKPNYCPNCGAKVVGK